MKLDANFLRRLLYEDVNLKDMEIEMVDDESGGDDGELSCGIGVKDGLPMTEGALKQLCAFLKIPYPFTRQLRAQGRLNVLSYIQRQLSQATQASVVLVQGERSIVSITARDKMHFTGAEMLDLDKRLTALVKDSPLELADVVTDRGVASYYLLHRQGFETEKDGTWKWGHVLTLSALGEAKHPIETVVKRCSDSGMAILPKAYSHEVCSDEINPQDPDMEDRWEAIASFVKDPPSPLWDTLDSLVGKSLKTTASFREVKEARSKLGKLKIDKDDRDTLARINGALQMKKITEQYAVKDLPYIPSRMWYCRAATPLRHFFLVHTVMREAASASASLPLGVRRGLYLHAGSLLAGTPDLCPEQNPPVIDWDRV